MGCAATVIPAPQCPGYTNGSGLTIAAQSIAASGRSQAHCRLNRANANSAQIASTKCVSCKPSWRIQ